MNSPRPFARLFLVAFSALSLIAVGSTAAEPGETWPQWRGPGRDSAFLGETWPQSIGADALAQQWRKELGPSYSGPVVTEELVITTATEDKKFEVVRAYDRRSGEQKWEAKWEGSLTVPFFAASNGSWVRATPAYDGENVYVAGIRDVLVCLDAKTGAQKWRIDFVEQTKSPVPAFGFVCSPLVEGGYVYVQAGAAVCKVDKQTGEIVWRKLRDGGGMSGSAFSSPVVAELAGEKQLVVQTRSILAGVDLKSGEELWSQKITATRGMNILTPTVYSDSIYTATIGGGAWRFDIAKQQGDFNIDEAWKASQQGYMSSPVIIDGYLYLHLKNQRFTCIDLKTGESTWTTAPFGKYWSMVKQGDRILALDEEGVLRLIQANPDEYQELDSRKISNDPTWAHLAVVNGQIFIRELNALTAYRWKAAE